MRSLCWLWLCLPLSLLAQPMGPVPSQESRAIHDRADAIAVVRTIGGTATPERTSVLFDVRVQVVRVLKGQNLSDGQELLLVFEDDRPLSPLPSPQPVQPSTGLVFLARRGEGWQPLRQNGSPAQNGGFLLHLPEGSRPTTTSADLQTQIGLELAAALEFWGAHAAAALDARGGFGPFPPRQPSGPEASWFVHAANYLNGPVVDPAPFAAIYPELARSGSPHVRMVGIVGLIKLQQPEGLQALQQSLPQSMKAAGVTMLVAALRRWNVSKQPATVETLGRIAISEATHPQVESAASWTLGQHALVDALPYFATLLESPHPQSRAGALMGICNLHRGGDPRAVLQHYSGEEARPHCPNRLPVTDADAEREHVAFWRNWWETNRERVENDFRGDGAGNVVPFARAAAPSRWVDTRQPGTQISQGTPEQALRMMLHLFHPDTTARTEGKISEADRVRGILRMEADEQDISTLIEELRKGSLALREVETQFREAMAEHRLAGRPPDPSVVQQANERTGAVMQAFLRDCESRLSPDAWRQLQEAIARMARDTVRTSLSPPGRRP